MNHNFSKQLQQRLAIAIATDAAYAEQVVTLIKSICYHHRNVHFYILNKDFPFRLGKILHDHLAELDCEITNIQIKTDFKGNMPSHISEAGFYRFIIPEINEDRILYLDADIIVDGSLYELFTTDLGDKLAVAMPDIVLDHPDIEHGYMEFPNLKPYFNSGVLLINNLKWREQNILEQAKQMAQKYNGLIYADQDVLNILLRGQVIMGDVRYNFQTGARFGLYERQMHKDADGFEQSCPNPTIIHYTGRNKAWLNHKPILHAERYWFYYNLTWRDIKEKWAK